MKKSPLLLLLFCHLAWAQQQPVNVGTGPNSGNGDPLRVAFSKLNANDAELFGMFGPYGILKGNGPAPSALTAASAADLVQLFKGCGGTLYLGADGACHGIDLTAGALGLLPVVSGGTGTSSLSGLLRGNGTSAVTSATNSDVRALWTGTCSAASFLRGDGACAAVGSVASVGLSVPSWLAVGGSPVTSSGTLAVTAAGGQVPNQFLATPSGSVGAVGLRSIVAADLPPISLGTGVSGVLPAANGGTGESGTITGLVKGNGTSAFTVATSADVIGLFTGCTGIQYLGADGACHVPTTAAAGSDAQLQYNVSGALGASSALVWNYANNILVLGTSSAAPIITATSGASMTLQAGTPLNNTANGNTLNLFAQGGGGMSGNGGAVNLIAGSARAGAGGSMNISAGSSTASGNGGGVTINAGTGSSGTGGVVSILAGNASLGNGGSAGMVAGNSTGTTNVVGGQATLAAGNALATTSGNGGNVVITAGIQMNPSCTGAHCSGGNVTITSGTNAGGGSGSNGYVLIQSAAAAAGSGLPAGSVNIQGGQGDTVNAGSVGGAVAIFGGFGGGATANGGNATIGGGSALTGGNGGNVLVESGSASGGIGGVVTITAPTSSAPGSSSGSINISTGNAVTTGKAGDITIMAGTGSTNGNIALNAGGAQAVKIFGTDGGVTVGSPSGGDKGPGTINATAVYVNGTAIGAGSQTATAIGTAGSCTTSPTVTVQFDIVGNVVIARIPKITCTANGSPTQFNLNLTFPAGASPANSQSVAAMMINNGSGTAGFCAVNSSVGFQCYTPTGASLAGTIGIGEAVTTNAIAVTYMVN